MTENLKVVPGVVIQPGRNDIEPSDVGAIGFAHYKLSRSCFFLGFDPGKTAGTFIIPAKFCGGPIVLVCRVPVGDSLLVVCDGSGRRLPEVINERDYRGYGGEGNVLVVISNQGGAFFAARYSLSCADSTLTIKTKDLSPEEMILFSSVRR